MVFFGICSGETTEYWLINVQPNDFWADRAEYTGAFRGKYVDRRIFLFMHICVRAYLIHRTDNPDVFTGAERHRVLIGFLCVYRVYIILGSGCPGHKPRVMIPAEVPVR